MKKSPKVFGVTAMILFAALVLVPASFGKTVIKVGTSSAPDHIYNKGLEYFEKIVEEKTGGSIDVQIFPAAQLGSERDLVEGLQLGTVEMTLTSTGPLGNFVPQVKLFNLPFLFKDRQSCYEIMDGPIGSKLADLFPRIGLRSLGWYENGFRNVTNSKRPIDQPEDMKGLKIRVMEDDIFIISMKALGASPLPMAFGELYTALEQGTVDAQENPLAVIYSSRFFEVQKYLAMTGHFYSPAMLLVGEGFWQGLSKEQQAIIRDAAVQARDYERKLSVEADRILEAACKEKGMIVTHPAKGPFIEAVAGVYADSKVIRAIGGGNAKEGEALVKAAQAAAK